MSSKPIYIGVISALVIILTVTLTIIFVNRNNTNLNIPNVVGGDVTNIIKDVKIFNNDTIFPSEIGETLRMKIDVNNNYIVGETENDIYVKLDFSAIKYEAEKKLPLNISLVLDRSGSMAGEKLEQAKKAVVAFINSLSPNDYLSIVAYESGVETVYAQSKVENAEGLKKKVMAIMDAGGTFLSGGLEEGIKQVLSRRSDEFVNRVILFSDGQANEGVSDVEGLRKIAEKALNNGISISTMGVGLDYDEKIMTAIAVAGSGNYQFIKDAEQIPKILAREMSQLKNIVASRAKVTIIHDPAIKFVETYGYTYKSDRGYVEIPVRDFFSEDKCQMLLHFTSLGRDISDHSVKITLSYKDAIRDNIDVTFDSGVALSITNDMKIYNEHINTLVMSEVLKIKNTLAMEQANQALERGEIEEAKKIYTKSIDDTDAFVSSYGDVNKVSDQVFYMNKQKDVLDSPVILGPSEVSSILKSNRAYNLDTQQARDNNADVYNDNNDNN